MLIRLTHVVSLVQHPSVSPSGVIGQVNGLLVGCGSNIEAAVNAVLDAGYRTGDIMQGGCTKLSCSEMGDMVVKNI